MSYIMWNSTPIVTGDIFEFYARPIIQNSPGLYNVAQKRRFLALFGVSPTVCAVTWNYIAELVPDKASPAHLLWALIIMKVYSTEQAHARICSVEKKILSVMVMDFRRASCKY